MPRVIPFLMALFASAVLPCTALAQDGDPLKDRERPKPPPAPPSVQNNVELNLRYHYSQKDPILEKSHGQFPFGSSMNRFAYRGTFTFDPPDEAGVPFPLTISLTTEFAKTAVSTKFVNSTVITGNPRSDPTSTKPGLFGSGGSGGGSDAADSDTHLLFGPDFDYVLAQDVTEWKPTSWMPQGTSLHAYATALFGSFTVFDTSANMELYSAGLRLGMPLFTVGDSFFVSAILSAGPAYLHTSIGSALGIDLGTGLRGTWLLSNSFALVATIGVNAFSSSNTFSWGPTLNLGFILSW